MKKLRVEVNDNLRSIFNYINSAIDDISFNDILQFAIDYDCYKEFYLNLDIIFKLYEEHKNKKIEMDSKKTIL